VQDSSVGSKVAIDALRQGKPIRLAATIEPRRSQGIGGRLFFESQVGGMAQVRRPVTSSGIQMMAITPQLALFFQVPGQGGVLVLGVEPESPYARAGIMAGDVIFAVDSQSVSDPLTLTSYLQTQAGSQRVVLRTVRRGAERRASVEIQPQNAPAPPARKP
jgi:C-terminal processing protease CtpA/Prc